MRLGGFGYRQYLTRAALLACAMLFVCAASASAATRLVVPTGGKTSGTCDTAVEACTLDFALSVAGASDTVSLDAGIYPVSAPISTNADVVGEGSEATKLVGSAGVGGPVLSLTQNATIADLHVESNSAGAALDLTGTGLGLEVYGGSGDAMTLRNGSDLSTSVVHTAAAGAIALRAESNVLSTVTVRHSTVVGTGSGSTAIDGGGLLGTATVTNTIAYGVANDIVGTMTYPINTDYSAFRIAKSPNTNGTANNRNSAATFVDAPARNFQQDPTSPTVNTGGGAGAPDFDLAGNPRTIGGAMDIGAYELPIKPTVTTGAANPVAGRSATIAGTVNPQGTATSYGVRYGTASPPATTSGTTNAGDVLTDVAASTALSDLLPGTRYYYRVTATNAWGTTEGAIATFDTPSVAPAASDVSSAPVTDAAAQLGGKVDPGGASTAVKFLWGETGAYGSESATQTITGSVPTPVTPAGLSGLKPGTEYHFRLTATNVHGTSTADGTFTTDARAPVTTTGPATAISTSGATVNGTVDPGGAPTTWSIEYGPGYGQTATGATINGVAPENVSKALTGLLPGTTYPYRVVAVNSEGTYRATGSFDTQVALPAASLGGAERVTDRGARVGATVNPGGDAASYRFEYGTGGGYDQSTSTHHLSDDTSDSGVSRNLSGLEPGTVYDYRVVVTNSAGTITSAGGTFTTEVAKSGRVDEPVGPVPAGGSGPVQADGLPVATARPTAGRATNAAPAGGTVRVQVPGTSEFVELTEGAALPVGTVVDATEGEITVTSAADLRGTPQTANFGGSEFKIQQKRTRKPVTDILMSGGDFRGCLPRALNKQSADVFAAARRKWSRRRLWGNGHGRFRTRGRHGTATVRGTHWLTEDRCDGTLVRVKRGLVEVRDLQRRRTVMVAAGEQYIAKSLAFKKASRRKR